MTHPSSRMALVPAYLHNFQCIGGDCEDNCCTGWRVDIDKNTYKKIRLLPKSEVAESYRKHVKLTENGNERSYAHMQMRTEDKACPMLDETRMCSVQKNLGPELLSKVCNDYPRQYTAVGMETRIPATLSCPEAARLCLNDASGWAWTEMPLNIPQGKKVPYSKGVTSVLETSPDFKRRHHQRLADFAVQALQHRDLAIWERLLLVGMACQKIEATVTTFATVEEVDRAVEQIVLQSRLALLDGSFAAQTQELSSLAQTDKVQQAFIAGITRERLEMLGINRTFFECVKDAFDGLQIHAANAAAATPSWEAAKNCLNEFLANQPHMMENYLLNTLAVDVFPLSSQSLVAQWHDFMIRYALVRFYLAGMALRHGDAFTAKHFIKLIYSFSRNVQHNSRFLPRVHELLAQENLDSLATMAILVR